jgi:hypothetical protein
VAIDAVVGLNGRILSGYPHGFTFCIVQFHLIIGGPGYYVVEIMLKKVS